MSIGSLCLVTFLVHCGTCCKLWLQRKDVKEKFSPLIKNIFFCYLLKQTFGTKALIAYVKVENSKWMKCLSCSVMKFKIQILKTKQKLTIRIQPFIQNLWKNKSKKVTEKQCCQTRLFMPVFILFIFLQFVNVKECLVKHLLFRNA